MNKRVLVVAAHTDDEALGCGGTIARHVAEGDTVHAIFLADGVGSRKDGDLDSLKLREAAAQRAHAILGIETVQYLGMPDNKLDSLPLLEIVQRLEGAIAEYSPQIIYTHHHGDLNVDHRITHQAVMTACRPLPGSSVKEIYTFEVMSSTEWNTAMPAPFLPTYFIDIGHYLPVKIKALEAYGLEMRPVPHSRSIQHLEVLAKHRGYCSGLDAAEAFMIVRKIEGTSKNLGFSVNSDFAAR